MLAAPNRQKAVDGMYIVHVRCKFEMYTSKLDRLETYFKIIIIMILL